MEIREIFYHLISNVIFYHSRVKFVTLQEQHANTVQLDLNFKKLACAIAYALHEQQKIRCVLVSARKLDDVSAAHGE